MRTKHLLREARRRLKRKKRSLSESVRKEVLRLISELESALDSRSKKEVVAARKKLETYLHKHARKTGWEIVREYANSFLVAILIALFVRHFFMEPFKIPSTSMLPTLRVKDKIFVNKLAYGARVPFRNAQITTWSSPERWDIIVFTTKGIPLASERVKDFVKRVVGLPGETIEIRDGEIYLWEEIDGKEVARLIPKPESLKSYYTNKKPHTKLNREAWDYDSILGLIRIKKPGTHRIEVIGEWAHGMKNQKIRVPENHYFVLGDNSEFSLDGRAWGFVPEKNIKGRAFFIWLPFSRIGPLK